MARGSARQVRVVLVMAGNGDQALAIARALVEGRLAACVNIVAPVRSIYRWRGAIEDEQEHMLVIKTRANLIGKVERRVKELHSYEVPEFLALPVDSGSRAYVDWLFDSTANKGGAK